MTQNDKAFCLRHVPEDTLWRQLGAESIRVMESAFCELLCRIRKDQPLAEPDPVGRLIELLFDRPCQISFHMVYAVCELLGKDADTQLRQLLDAKRAQPLRPSRTARRKKSSRKTAAQQRLLAELEAENKPIVRKNARNGDLQAMQDEMDEAGFGTRSPKFLEPAPPTIH